MSNEMPPLVPSPSSQQETAHARSERADRRLAALMIPLLLVIFAAGFLEFTSGLFERAGTPLPVYMFGSTGDGWKSVVAQLAGAGYFYTSPLIAGVIFLGLQTSSALRLLWTRRVVSILAMATSMFSLPVILVVMLLQAISGSPREWRRILQLLFWTTPGTMGMLVVAWVSCRHVGAGFVIITIVTTFMSASCARRAFSRHQDTSAEES